MVRHAAFNALVIALAAPELFVPYAGAACLSGSEADVCTVGESVQGDQLLQMDSSIRHSRTEPAAKPVEPWHLPHERDELEHLHQVLDMMQLDVEPHKKASEKAFATQDGDEPRSLKKPEKKQLASSKPEKVKAKVAQSKVQSNKSKSAKASGTTSSKKGAESDDAPAASKKKTTVKSKAAMKTKTTPTQASSKKRSSKVLQSEA